MMKTKEDLLRTLARIDGRGYRAYKDLEGAYDLGELWLFVDHAQGDPFAGPSRARVQVRQERAQIPPWMYQNKVRRIALQDYLTRQFAAAVRAVARGSRGIGGSGRVSIDEPGQEVLERTSCRVDREIVEVRFTLGLPAEGRTVLGRQAEEMLLGEVPEMAGRALVFAGLPGAEAAAHVESVEDQECIRGQLDERGWAAFLANGSLLPRRSGIDDRPAGEGEVGGPVVPLQSPPGMEAEVGTPHRGAVRGMAIPRGVTLIVGGGFHGKSTLLQALEKGVYPHIPGDGREGVVSHPACVKIRSEDGRSVEGVDISPFLSGLPLGKNTREFSTDNASGSTSQAAGIMEALEAGARVLLIDEDTSAANFMIRDRRMQQLVSKDKEPITPFVDKVRQLYGELEVSTILVMGGSSDYFEAADRVVWMDAYLPREATARVAEIVRDCPGQRVPEGGERFGSVPARCPLPESFDPSLGRREVKIEARGAKTLLYGRTRVDLSLVGQVAEESQTRAMGELAHYCALRYFNGEVPLAEGLKRGLADLEEKGLDLLSPFKRGDLALPRIFEAAAAINRMRTLKVRQKTRKE